MNLGGTIMKCVVSLESGLHQPFESVCETIQILVVVPFCSGWYLRLGGRI